MNSDSAETCEGVWREKKKQVEKKIDRREVAHRSEMCQIENLG